MTSEEFVKLYKTSTSLEEVITPLKEGVGFTLVREYESDCIYSKENKKMFILLYLSDCNIGGGIDMVSADEDNLDKYKVVTDKKITNFRFGKEEELFFDKKTSQIYYTPKGKYFSINELVDILVANHLSDKLFWKRQKNILCNRILRFLFWLSDKHYEMIQVMLERYHPNPENKIAKKDDKNIEPFFKYFYISKNILFLFLFVAFPLSILIPFFWFFKDFSISNPTVILFLFLILFIFEKLSVWLDGKIKSFFKDENNFIAKLHNYQFFDQFKLKLKK